MKIFMMKPRQYLSAILILAGFATGISQFRVVAGGHRGWYTHFNFRGFPAENPQHEWFRSNPDIIVYLPKGNSDGDNEHFLVFEAPKSNELIAIWTQSSVEGRGDNRAVTARSADGIVWSEPRLIAGTAPGGAGMQASWAFPIVSEAGRIYCFYTKETERTDPRMRQSSGALGCA